MQDRVIAVTGAQGVLGRAVIGALAASGARPVAIDVAGGEPPDGAVLSLARVDGADPAAAETAATRILQEFGALHGLVNVAGGFAWETILDGDEDTWDRLFRINVRTALVTSRAAVPALLASGGGAIVNVGAAAAGKAAMGMGAYAASKSGVARLTEALAEELKDRNIRVNAVLPSIIDTPANRSGMPDADPARWVTPAALARVVLFLLSDSASPITGALLPVTGRV